LISASPDGARCLLPQSPLSSSRALAERFGCDLAIPSKTGMGNVLMYTRLVEDLSRRLGRPLTLLSGPMRTAAGRVEDEEPYPVWGENPHVGGIIDPSDRHAEDLLQIEVEQDNLCQFGHLIENLAFHYDVRPSALRPSLFLSRAECMGAMERLRDLPRPLICLHPYGTSSPLPGHGWHLDNWRMLIERIAPLGSLFEVGLDSIEHKNLGLPRFRTRVREMMALVWASDLFIGFDSSVAHIATAFEKPAIVLWEPIRKVEIEERYQQGFGAAAVSRWGYPQNRNLMLLGDRGEEIIDVIEHQARKHLSSVGWRG